MKVLIKLGGTLLDSAESRQRVAVDMAAAVQTSAELVIVHGGGKQITRFLEERGIQSNFVNGLRVSDEHVIDAVTKVIAGTVNKQLVSALIAQGVPAVGLSGIDGTLTAATQLNKDLGWVGKPADSRGSLLDLLRSGGYVPVVACVAGDAQGHIYNVNADQMAVSCALGWHADRLIFLTDVKGVKNASGDVLSTMTPEESRQLIASGVAHGGMQAKLEAALKALEGGIPEVGIAWGQEDRIAQRLLAGETLGTRMLGNEVSV